MSAAPKKASWMLRLALAVALVIGAGWAMTYALRPVVYVALATTGTAVRTVPGTVEVKAEFAIELKSEVGGRVSSTELDVGKRVHKDDVLVQIDTGDVDLDIERIRNEITAARRKVELGSLLRPEVLNSQDTLANLERQAKAGVISATDFEKARRLHQQIVQRMELDEVNLRLALQTNENLLSTKLRERGKMLIIAPSDGIVTTVAARAGDLIGSNSPIATIISVGRTVEAKISEEKFADIKLGQKASVRFLTYGANQYNAVISKILPSADATTQRYTVFLDISLPEGHDLKPGLTGEVSIIIAKRANAVIVPRRALVGEYLCVVEGGRLALRKVVKGYEGLNEVEILSGLQAGESVVVEQQDRYREGERVRTQVLPN